MSRGDLAEASGLSYPYMSELETGSKYPSDRALENIAAALDVSPFDLERLAQEAEAAHLYAREEHARGLQEQETISQPRSGGIGVEDQLVEKVLAEIEPVIRNAIRIALGDHQ